MDDFADVWETFRLARLRRPRPPQVRLTFRYKTGQVLCSIEGLGAPRIGPSGRPVPPMVNGTGTDEAQALVKAMAAYQRDQERHAQGANTNGGTNHANPARKVG